MIRIFAPPTPDAVIRRNAVTVSSFLLHVALFGLLLIPVSRVVKQSLLDRVALFLVPPDTPGGEPEPIGHAPAASVATPAGILASGKPQEEPSSKPEPARGTVPLLSMVTLSPMTLLRPEDHAYTELQVDSVVMRDPNSAAPQYPRDLLHRGIEGLAAVLYVVDSTGLVDTTSYRVVNATRPEFGDAVRRALPEMRFRPAFEEGHPVRQLVQQTFRFKINRDTLKTALPIPQA